MFRLSYRPIFLALVLTSCSVLPTKGIEYINTVETKVREVPEEFKSLPLPPKKATTPQSIEQGLNLGNQLRIYSCGLFLRYSLVIEYFTEGDVTVELPGTDRC